MKYTKIALLCGLLWQSSQVLAWSKSTSVIVLAGTTLALGASSVEGVYNIRTYDQILSQCEHDYGLVYEAPLLDLPFQYGQKLICADTFEAQDDFRMYHGICMTEVATKIELFDTTDVQTIWDFQRFKNRFPYTDDHGKYGIAKSYLASFGYYDLGSLKHAVADHIEKIKTDIKSLEKLTDLFWHDQKIPVNYQQFQNLQDRLSRCYNYYGFYTMFGAAGYSCIHNCNRTKSYIIALTKRHAFLMQLQELLQTSLESDDTPLMNSSGFVHFAVQHIHQVQQRV